ncbi:hypothetical protein GCM10025738_25700 [Microbacterium fluvii]
MTQHAQASRGTARALLLAAWLTLGLVCLFVIHGVIYFAVVTVAALAVSLWRRDPFAWLYGTATLLLIVLYVALGPHFGAFVDLTAVTS